jgi:hypothetical protein
VKCGLRIALGVAGGYFLGRTKKMKLAMMLGGMAAGRQAGGPGQLLAQGAKLLGQSPELTRLTDELRGRLLDAGKGAAVAIATRQVENLTERVVNRVGTTLADAGGKTVGDVGGTVGGAVGDVGKTIGGLGRRQSREDVEDVEEPGEEPSGEPTDLEEPADDTQSGPAEGNEDEEEAGEAPAPRRGPARSGASGAGGGAAGAALKRPGALRVQQRERPVPAGVAGAARGRRGRGDG